MVGVDKHRALFRHHLESDRAGELLTILECAHRPGRHVLQHGRCHTGGYDTKERSLRIENRRTEANRLDSPVGFVGRHVIDLNLSRLSCSLKPAGLAVILAAERRLGRGYHDSLGVCDTQPEINRIIPLHPSQVTGQVGRVGRPQRELPRHHLGVAIALEQKTIKLVGDLGRSNSQFFPGRRNQSLLDVSKQKHPGHQGHQVHQDNQLRQPPIPLRIEGPLKIFCGHARGVPEQMKF